MMSLTFLSQFDWAKRQAVAPSEAEIEVVDKVNNLACSKASRFEKQGKSANAAYLEIRKGADLPQRRRRWEFFNRLNVAALFWHNTMTYKGSINNYKILQKYKIIYCFYKNSLFLKHLI